VWTHWKLNLFFLLNPFFAICLNFQNKIHSEINYLPHLTFENYEIQSIKYDSPRAFQQHQEHPPIPIRFAISILFNFHWKLYSIINSFHTIAPNNLKSSQCTPTHWELSKDIKSITWNTMVWEISTWQN